MRQPLKGHISETNQCLNSIRAHSSLNAWRMVHILNSYVLGTIRGENERGKGSAQIPFLFCFVLLLFLADNSYITFKDFQGKNSTDLFESQNKDKTYSSQVTVRVCANMTTRILDKMLCSSCSL